MPEPVLRLLLYPFQRTRDKKITESFKIKQVERFDARFDKLWEKVKNSQKIWLRRTSTYLNWRYVYSPLYDYQIFISEDVTTRELLGYVVVSEQARSGFRLGLILDIIVLPEKQQAASALIRRGLAALQGADAAGCLMLRHQPIARALKDNGMIPLPDWISPKKFHVTVACLTDDTQLNSIVRNQINWYLTWGDTDNV